MPRPYSYDLRVRVMAVVEKGMEVRDASHMFGVHRDTITAWVARKEATGDVQANVGYQRGHSHKIVDSEQFKAFVQDHSEATVEELAEVGVLAVQTIVELQAKAGAWREYIVVKDTVCTTDLDRQVARDLTAERFAQPARQFHARAQGGENQPEDAPHHPAAGIMRTHLFSPDNERAFSCYCRPLLL
jgi:transposase